MSDYLFPQPLLRGLIKSRPNRFLMNVEVDGAMHLCHCPATGSIGGVIFEDIPCLVSPALGERKTSHTVEAVDLNLGGWAGINQGAVNRYIEHFLRAGLLPFGKPEALRREIKLGGSRLDFQMGQTYIEVKTPLIEMPCGSGIRVREGIVLSSYQRLVKHFEQLAASLGREERALMLVCFVYDAPLFQPTAKGGGEIVEIQEVVAQALQKGVEIWQVNMELQPHGVALRKFFEITQNFL